MYQQQLPQLQTNIRKVMFADFPTMHFPNPGTHHVFFEDFTNFTATIVDANPPTVPGWTCIQVANNEGGIVIADGVGGLIALDSEATTAQFNGVMMQKDSESFLPAAGNPLWFEARFSIDAQTDDCIVFIGLAETGNAGGSVMPAGICDHANIQYIGFAVETTWNTGMQFVSAATNLLEIDIPCLTLVDNTWFRIAFYICPTGQAYQYVDDVLITGATPIPFADVPTVELRPTIAIQTDNATDEPVLTVDYMRVVQVISR